MKYKFRGMSVETKEWVYGDLVHRGYDGTSRLVPVGIASPGFYPIEVIPETVGMWTEEIDDSGKEIYLGDRCALFSLNDDNEVSCDGETYIWFNGGSFKTRHHGFPLSSWTQNKRCFIVVIGNIYEKEKPL